MPCGQVLQARTVKAGLLVAETTGKKLLPLLTCDLRRLGVASLETGEGAEWGEGGGKLDELREMEGCAGLSRGWGRTG